MAQNESPSSANEVPFPKPASKTKPKFSGMFAEAKSLQALILAESKRAKLKPIELSSLARVWKELGEFRLRLQGKGPPKAVDVLKLKRNRRSTRVSFADPDEPSPQTSADPSP